MTWKERWREVPKWLQIIIYTILGAIAAVGFGLLFGIIIRALWNWLMPMVFGLPAISFWQGVGLFVLAKILFGGFSAHGESSKSSKKPTECKDWDDKKMGYESWNHYDEWWESEGKDAFASYAQKATATPAHEVPHEDA